MRLAHLTWLLSARGGGIPPVARALADEQRRAGHEVRILGVEDPAAQGEPEVGEQHRALGPLALGFAPGLGRALGRDGPDLLHLHGLFTWPSQVASGWGARTGRPVLVSPHGMLQSWALANSAWKKRLFRFLVEDRNLSRARCLHALCEDEALSLRRLGLTNPVAVVPNGVALDEVPATPDRSALVRAHPELAGRRILLFLGRIHPKKGIPLLLDAWGRLRDEGALGGWLLLVVGPDQVGHAAEIRARVSALRLEQEVRLWGPAYGEEKKAMLAAADAFVLPSYSEGFSMAVLEAMAWGLPALVSRPCNLDVEAPGAGLLCEPEEGSVAERLRALLSLSDDERRAMGSRGRAEVERRYTWPVVAAQFVQVYQWLLGGGAPPATVESAR